MKSWTEGESNCCSRRDWGDCTSLRLISKPEETILKAQKLLLKNTARKILFISANILEHQNHPNSKKGFITNEKHQTYQASTIDVRIISISPLRRGGTHDITAAESLSWHHVHHLLMIISIIHRDVDIFGKGTCLEIGLWSLHSKDIKVGCGEDRKNAGLSTGEHLN